MCVCSCVSTHVCRGMCICRILLLLRFHPLGFWRQGLPFVYGSAIRLNCLVNRPQGSVCLSLPGVGWSVLTTIPGFLQRLWGLNSGPLLSYLLSILFFYSPEIWSVMTMTLALLLPKNPLSGCSMWGFKGPNTPPPSVELVREWRGSSKSH